MQMVTEAQPHALTHTLSLLQASTWVMTLSQERSLEKVLMLTMASRHKMELMLPPDREVMEALSLRVIMANANLQRNIQKRTSQDLAAKSTNGSLKSAMVAHQSGVPNLLTVNLSSSSVTKCKTKTAWL